MKSRRHQGLSSLFATSLIQIAASFTIAGPLAIAVLILEAESLPERWLGYYTSLMYAAAIIGSVATSMLLATFSIRFIQLAALVATGIGYTLFAQIGSSPLALATAITGIVFMGLAYGVIVPSGSIALAQCYSQKMQPLVVSVRQTGVPVGTALVALAAPAAAYAYGWQAVTPIVWSLLGLTALVSLPGLKPFKNKGHRPPGRAHLFSAWQVALGDPATRRLALVAGAYGINQAALTTYLVISLVWFHDMSVGRAAGYLALATMAGAAARVIFGITSVRFGRADLHLGLLGLLAGLAWLLLLWPTQFLFQIFIGSVLLGVSAMGWNGILLAQIGLAAPAGKTAEAVSSGTSFAYLGVLVAPLIFVQLEQVLSSRKAALAGLSILAIAAGAALLRAANRSKKAD